MPATRGGRDCGWDCTNSAAGGTSPSAPSISHVVGMARAWLVALLLHVAVSAVSADLTAVPAAAGADCTWRKDLPACAAMCDKTNIRAPDCNITDSNERCKWCTQVDVRGESSDLERALFCSAHYFLDPWDADVVDLRPCLYDTERQRCHTAEGPGGRLQCQNLSPPPAAPPPMSPLAAAIDLNVFDIAAIIIAALLTAPLIMATKDWLRVRWGRTTVAPKEGQELGVRCPEIEVPDDLQGRAKRGRASQKQDKRTLLEPGK